ncbi:MAG: acyl-CoA dehydrogenase family protein [Thermoleophilaceae bacterium]
MALTSAPSTLSIGRAAARPGPDALEAIEHAAAAIADGAAERDRRPSFPVEAFDRLTEAGALGLTVPGPGGSRAVPFAVEWSAVRMVARADGSAGRIYDGHLNAVERLAVAAPEPLRSQELDAVDRGVRALGVWGADPRPEEGEPARLVGDADRLALEGVKVFCSGAGGLDRALVLVRGEEAGPPLLAYVDLSCGVHVDRGWYRGAGMRASESHRVVFDGAPVLALLGAPGELGREPWFGRDAIRTAASWAGVADTAADAALDLLAAGPDPGEAQALAAGRIIAARGTIDAWLEHAAALCEHDPGAPTTALSVSLREEVARACRLILDEAARATGSRPFVTGGALDRARRDLEVFLLQHRLDPLVARIGRAAIEERRRP